MLITIPNTITELLERAQMLRGFTLAKLAQQVNIPLPANTKNAKGWIGTLLEQILGATATSRPEPDFIELGVELKTIPVDNNYQPLESTYICMAPHTGEQVCGIDLYASLLYRKLQQVLWIPILSKDVPLAQRIILAPVFWQPDSDELAIVEQDWQELVTLIKLGEIENITAHHGQALQLRPKAAHARSIRIGTDTTGTYAAVLPRGFYLRSSFTANILRRGLCL